LEINPLAHNVL